MKHVTDLLLKYKASFPDLSRKHLLQLLLGWYGVFNPFKIFWATTLNLVQMRKMVRNIIFKKYCLYIWVLQTYRNGNDFGAVVRMIFPKGTDKTGKKDRSKPKSKFHNYMPCIG